MPTRKRMHVVVDGLVYGFQKHGGINTYLNETLPRIARQYNARVDVLVPFPRVGQPPRDPLHIAMRNILPSRTGISSAVDRFAIPVLDRINMRALDLRLRLKQNCVFHSTYFAWIGPTVPQVASAYDMNHELFPKEYDNPWGQWLRKQYFDCLTRATRIIAVSQKTKADIVKFYDIHPDVIDVVHLAVNRQVFRPSRESTRLDDLQARTGIRLPYCLYVGLRQSYKNFPRLLQAFAQSAATKGAYLVVAGKPWQPAELRLIRELGLESRTHLVIDPCEATLRDLYSFSAAFVYPSSHEGFGIPLLEALACGTAVLASDIAVFREVAGDAAIYFDPCDSGSFSRAMETALDPTTRSEYLARGFEQVARFSWDKCAAQTYAVYQKASESL